MHKSFADTLVKWFFDNFSMFADSFSVLSIHCVARGLGASSPYKTALHRTVLPCDSSARPSCLVFSCHTTWYKKANNRWQHSANQWAERRLVTQWRHGCRAMRRSVCNAGVSNAGRTLCVQISREVCTVLDVTEIIFDVLYMLIMGLTRCYKRTVFLTFMVSIMPVAIAMFCRLWYVFRQVLKY